MGLISLLEGGSSNPVRWSKSTILAMVEGLRRSDKFGHRGDEGRSTGAKMVMQEVLKEAGKAKAKDSGEAVAGL